MHSNTLSKMRCREAKKTQEYQWTVGQLYRGHHICLAGIPIGKERKRMAMEGFKNNNELFFQFDETYKPIYLRLSSTRNMKWTISKPILIWLFKIIDEENISKVIRKIKQKTNWQLKFRGPNIRLIAYFSSETT